MKTLLIAALILAAPVYAATRPDTPDTPQPESEYAPSVFNGTVNWVSEDTVSVTPDPIDSERSRPTRTLAVADITPRESLDCPSTLSGYSGNTSVTVQDFLHDGDYITVVISESDTYAAYFHTSPDTPPATPGSINATMVSSGHWETTSPIDSRYRDDLLSAQAQGESPSSPTAAACAQEEADTRAEDERQERRIRALVRRAQREDYTLPTAPTASNNGCPPGGCYNPNPCPPGGCR